MTLLDHYLKAVRLYLPKDQQDDIISELSEYLQSALDEKAEALGRPLTEVEQEDLLSKHGSPIVVAGRYGSKNLSVAFGRQLIGPELFPLYIRLLGANLLVITIVVFALAPFTDGPGLTLGRFIYPFVVQFVILTTIFTFVDRFQRRAKSARNWRFPPAHLQPVPRWQSVAGGVFLGAIALWWTALPIAPQLLLGRASRALEFSAGTAWLYWPVLLLLAAGAAQRATTFLRPDLNWVQSVTRLVTNGVAVALVYPFAQSYPYVIVSQSAADAAAAAATAVRINGGLWWSVLGTLSIYWFITAAYHLWLCVQQLRYARRRAAQTAN